MYLGVDPTWLRAAFVVLSVVSGIWSGVFLYIVALVLIPEEPRTGGVHQDWSAAPNWPGSQQDAAGQQGWVQPPQGSTETVQTPPAPTSPAPDAPAGSSGPSGWQSAPEPPPHDRG